MVQGRIVTIISLLAYFVVSITTIIYAYYFLKLEVSDWIPLISLLVFAGVFMLSGLGEILKVLRKPKLKIEDFELIPKNKGSEGEYKTLSLQILNNGGEIAEDCVFDIKVIDVFDFFSVNWIKDIYPNKRQSLFICRIIKNSENVIIRENKKHPLKMEKIYTIDVQFYGRNFKDNKIHQFKLDLSSWENVGIILDC